jgi:DNA-binding winged helix-turn-helix (wHTH) protein
MRVHFADFVLDLASRELLSAARRTHLSPKAFDLLAELVASRPRALSKADLQRRLWPGTFVAEANLSNLVGEIRTALGDDPRRPRFVRTVHRFGYAFCGEARDGGGRAAAGGGRHYRLVWTHGRLALSEGDYVLGRSPDLEVCLDSPSVSRRHARIRVAGDGVTVEDLGSKNGTYLRGKRLAGPAPLRDGDEIRLGSVRLKFRELGPEASTETGSRSSRG